jgi:Transposase IS66 family
VCDDYGGYKASFLQGINEIGCAAHARRKFFEMHANHGSQVAELALSFFAALYDIERAAAALMTQRKFVSDGSAIAELVPVTAVSDPPGRARRWAMEEGKRKNPTFVGWGFCLKHEEPDDYLLSHGSSALSSAWSRFTVLFGMGRGGTNSLWSSGMTCCCVVSWGKRHNQSGKK